ncbi:hypothetical protein HIMB100_00013770 [SAR116 cluster alpha proteobacterium HIMB100]|nr:hypothetical protein HIMB100_00013770 [SAR116 cluster alpha proteobacterium HIMB100]
MRDRLAQAMKQALKDKDQVALATIRLITAALKDRDIAARSQDRHDGISDDEILAMLQTMIKQRQESARMYDEGGRPDLVKTEQAEIAIIQQFLPEPLSQAEVESAIEAAMASTGAASVRDMGKVMSHLKAEYAGQIDFSSVSQLVKSRLMG